MEDCMLTEQEYWDLKEPDEYDEPEYWERLEWCEQPPYWVEWEPTRENEFLDLLSLKATDPGVGPRFAL